MLNAIKKIRINFSLIALAAVLAVTFFLLLLGNFKYYKSEVSILFIPKSESFAVHTPYVLENLIRFPRTLAFYERMLKNSEELPDQFSGQSKDGRKKMWNKILAVEKDDGSSIIKIGITARDKNQSQIFTDKTARALIDTASFYYNIKTDADFRVVERPGTTSLLKYWHWLVLASIILGTAAALALNFLFSITVRIIKNKKYQFQLPRAAEKPTPKIFPEKKLTPAKRSTAPANLPTAELKETIPEEIMPKEYYAEPTEEELKERLNQLLRGEM